MIKYKTIIYLVGLFSRITSYIRMSIGVRWRLLLLWSVYVQLFLVARTCTLFFPAWLFLMVISGMTFKSLYIVLYSDTYAAGHKMDVKVHYIYRYFNVTTWGPAERANTKFMEEVFAHHFPGDWCYAACRDAAFTTTRYQFGVRKPRMALLLQFGKHFRVPQWRWLGFPKMVFWITLK